MPSRSSATLASSRKPTRCTPTLLSRSSPTPPRRPARTIPEAVAAALKEKGPYTTVIGELSFNEKGDITRPDYVMYTWQKGADGKYTYLQNK